MRLSSKNLNYSPMNKAAVEQVMRRLTKEVSSFTVVVLPAHQDIADLQNPNPLVRLQNFVKSSVVLVWRFPDLC